MTMGWGATGDRTHVDPGRIRTAEEAFRVRYRDAVKRRRHLWIATVGFTVDVPLAEGARMDARNIIGRPAIECYVCESGYEPGAEDTPCPGEPG